MGAWVYQNLSCLFSSLLRAPKVFLLPFCALCIYQNYKKFYNTGCLITIGPCKYLLNYILFENVFQVKLALNNIFYGY